MKLVTYRITLREPVLVTALEGDPNSAVAHPYLPGSVLRGMLVGLARRQGQFDVTDPLIRRRFFENQTRFLNGYLLLGGNRSLPAPRSWEQNKYPEEAEKKVITDRALSQPEAEGQKPGKIKSLAGKFTVYPLEKGRAYLDEPKRVINVHTERERKAGRAGKDEGMVYRYEALEAGQIFEAWIVCDEEAEAGYLAGLLRQHPFGVIGGARSAGYGRVEFGEVEVKDPQREAGGPTVAPARDELVLTLLSDTILRNENGQPSPDVLTLKKVLASRLEIAEANLKIEKIFKGETLTGGFNRTWGLPLPQVQALAMGSVFVLDLTQLSEEEKAGLPDKLKSLEWLGLGERREDGFGRVAAGWQQLEKLEKQELPSGAAHATVELSQDSQQLWRKMEVRIQRQRTDRDQLAAANQLKFQKLPPTSQLNRLRQQITTALLKTSFDTTVITDFLKDIKGKRAGEHFEQARVNGVPMKDWLTQEAQKPDKYATLRLVDAMLANAAKARREQEEEERGVGND